MTFSAEVKDELMKSNIRAGHCKKARLLALCLFDPRGISRDEETGAYIYSFTSYRKTFNIYPGPDESRQQLLERPCCKRAFLAGAFIAAGTISDPGKEYRFEIILEKREDADELKGYFAGFNVAARVRERRNKYVFYIKDGEQIFEALAVMGAHSAMMKFENVRILKEMRSSVNRQVNCETANINKTVNAAMRQIEDIEYIRKTAGLESLDGSLAKIASARLENPDASLADIGQMLNPPVGKSGVNHRMRKLSSIAKQLGKKEQI